MTTKKALAVALLSATLAAGTLAGPAPSASADTPRCATFQEFRQVKVGMKKVRVHRILDFPGQSAGNFAGGYTRYYGSCQSVLNGGGDGGAGISFDGGNNRIVEKRWNGYV